MTAHRWTPETLASLNEAFERQTPLDVLRWAHETFGAGLVMATGFGLSGIVLLHHLVRLHPTPTVFYLETDLLFPETYALRDELTARLGIVFEAARSDVSLDRQAAEHGPNLWARDPGQCCFIRKVLPLRRYLADKSAWISGVRRDQSPGRARTGLVEWDRANGLVKLNPLAAWTREQVQHYIDYYDLPYNRLQDEGYRSIGCMPCTRPVAPGEDERAGRWAGFAKTECGIHVQPKAA